MFGFGFVILLLFCLWVVSGCVLFFGFRCNSGRKKTPNHALLKILIALDVKQSLTDYFLLAWSDKLVKMKS